MATRDARCPPVSLMPLANDPAASVRFYRVQPLPPNHPQPCFPTLPVVGAAGRSVEHFTSASRFLAPDVLLTPSGKVATYWALKAGGVRPGDRVAVSAYHCPTMIFPVIALGATPVFLPVTARGQVGLEGVNAALALGVRAVVVPHLFGFPTPQMLEIQQRCRAQSVVLIEDCAHALYARAGTALPGSFGDYAIASTRKFIPGGEGGALVANGLALEHPRRTAGLYAELRGLHTLWHDAYRYGTQRWHGRRASTLIGPADDEASQQEARPARASAEDLDNARVERLALKSVQWLVRHADHDRIASVRRQRFRRWAQALAGLSQVEAYAPELAPDHVPYVFPLRLQRPAAQFNALKYHGVAVWRWDQLAESACPMSAKLALELIQLPCQHSLSDTAFERLVSLCLRALATA